MSPLRMLAIALLQVYRFGISPILPASCRYTPTCSAYALDAVRRYGAVTGGWLGLRRLARCHPWGGCGHDPVPELPTRPDLPAGGGRWRFGLWMMPSSGGPAATGDGEPGRHA